MTIIGDTYCVTVIVFESMILMFSDIESPALNWFFDKLEID